eukprot:3398080-Rhodomonas_salina.1
MGWNRWTATGRGGAATRAGRGPTSCSLGSATSTSGARTGTRSERPETHRLRRARCGARAWPPRRRRGARVFRQRSAKCAARASPRTLHLRRPHNRRRLSCCERCGRLARLSFRSDLGSASSVDRLTVRNRAKRTVGFRDGRFQEDSNDTAQPFVLVPVPGGKKLDVTHTQASTHSATNCATDACGQLSRQRCDVCRCN